MSDQNAVITITEEQYNALRDGEVTPVVANDGPAADAVKAAEVAVAMRIIDQAIRSARNQGWCTEFDNLMAQTFPDGPPDGSKEFVDSDGWSCRGFDRDGYNRDGLDSDGRDRDGRNARGYDRDGYDRDGYTVHGYDRDGWNRERTININSPEYRARFRYDARGYDQAGFNANGLDRNGYGREEKARLDERTYVFDTDGWDVNGVNRHGETRDGRYVGRQ